jgi:periplasmic copper chaperone A
MTALHRAPLRTVLALATAAALGLTLPAAASAHVTVRPDDTAAGAWSKLTFRVPNESDTAGTVGLTVTFPTETPFAFVSVKPHAGWDVAVTREPLDEPVEAGSYALDEVVTAITWTARGETRIGPGQFDEFEVSVGPLPEEETTIELPADQLYSDGEVVSWSEPSDDHSDGSKPSPAFTVGGGDGNGHGSDDGHVDEVIDGSTEPAPTSSDPVEPQAASSAGGDDPAARVLAGVALVVGGAGLGVAAASLHRGRAGA